MFSGMLYIFTPLVIGYFFSINNKSLLETLNKATSWLIYIILFLMGLSLAALDNFGSNLKTIVTMTLVFFVSIGACNLLSLPLVDRILPLKTENLTSNLPLSAMALESLKLILVVGSGLVAGLLLPIGLGWVETASEWILLALLFFIGIQLRNSGLTLKQILVNKQGMAIALIIVVSSLIGGAIAAMVLDISVYKGLAMASGFGWYSLAGILMGDAFGPVYGGASFMIELLRELVALVFIPLLITRKPCTAIGYAGATAMDFTLPVIQSTGGVRCVPVAIVSGFILSLLVPVMMLFFVSLAG
ncbi:MULTISPECIES: lysine exporter LysO family protein [Vibrio]|uniref:Lysine exporter LysO family protein n=1 Tax=Vibrio mediterranei TaxID=689 RepID=A0A3G4V6E7_9VIBR|nr:MULTISPECIES: lysine exporter LysO family protein [Vibrio]AYV20065.1 lysine exporter LysO family protein [Vibrio mediterranei]EDL51629.1 predicted membrane protein [Vibrio mediterranei AK1]MCF4173275.1 lysine exporter LysO family protein [Vibrio sp. McD22-P3]NUW72724.1 lysine exporter LysO family protein [Vibrio mediterranei]USD99260.1 lysine exporter LysO family protein [Vibrio sp. SCSIO 43133]